MGSVAGCLGEKLGVWEVLDLGELSLGPELRYSGLHYNLFRWQWKRPHRVTWGHR